MHSSSGVAVPGIASRVLAALFIVALAIGLAVAPAYAEQAGRLGSGYITDAAGALGSQALSAERALEQLNEDHKVQVFVVFVRTFDGIAAQDWTDETASINGLGVNDVLIAVAVEDRQYAWSVDAGFELSDAELDEIATEYIEPELQRSDWAGAVLGAAEGYSVMLGGGTTPGDTPGDSGGDTPGTTSLAACALPLVFLVIVVGAVVFFVRRRKRTAGASAAAEQQQMSTADLEKRAGAALVGIDDALQTSEQELGFAEAEFGSEAVAGYRTTLEDAKVKVAEAFHIQQQVYDSQPEDEPTRRQMLQRIIELAEGADAALDAKAEDFKGLRDLAFRAEGALESVTKRLGAVEAAHPQAAAALAEMRRVYASAALGEVIDDDTQARDLITFAHTSIDGARSAIGEGDRGEAALTVRAAEDAVAQAERLLAAIGDTRERLAQARADALEEAAQLERTAAQAQGSPEAGAAAQVAIRLAVATREALAKSPSDPLAALDAVRSTATQLDEALGALRDAAARAEATRTSAIGAIASARNRIASTESFIATRRGAIGAEARANLQEAKARLASAEALVQHDAVKALSEAQATQQYADAAVQWAQRDVSAYSPAPLGGAQSPQQAGGGLGSVIIGSLIAGVLQDVIGGGSSGGSSGGGWSGGGFSPGSFGGSSARRSASRTFSGGGGRRGSGGRF